MNEKIDIKYICETVRKKKVIRGGKIKRRWVTDRPGYKVVVDPVTRRGKEVRMSPKEIMKRFIAARIRARKLAAMKELITRKREISMKRREGWK